jgi:molybdenum cofactor synthesis domain-containing protein
MARTAAALIIGNEILTGKIEEKNVAYLARELFLLGIALRRAVVCVDDVEVIATELDALRAAHDLVFTSGGIGPTHDDVTVEAVARAFGRPVVRSREIVELIHRHFGDAVREEHLRMADVPEGATLVRSGEMPWPTVAMDNVYVLPGVPEIFRMKFPVLRDRLREGGGFVSRALYTRADEFELAAPLAEVARQHPDVAIGSYLAWDAPDYAVKLTFDGMDRDAVTRALDGVVAALDASKIVRIE